MTHVLQPGCRSASPGASRHSPGGRPARGRGSPPPLVQARAQLEREQQVAATTWTARRGTSGFVAALLPVEVVEAGCSPSGAPERATVTTRSSDSASSSRPVSAKWPRWFVPTGCRKAFWAQAMTPTLLNEDVEVEARAPRRTRQTVARSVRFRSARPPSSRGSSTAEPPSPPSATSRTREPTFFRGQARARRRGRCHSCGTVRAAVRASREGRSAAVQREELMCLTVRGAGHPSQTMAS